MRKGHVKVQTFLLEEKALYKKTRARSIITFFGNTQISEEKFTRGLEELIRQTFHLHGEF